MDLTDLFTKYEFGRLPEDLLNHVWLDDYVEVVNLPPEYESFLEEIEIDGLICCTIECVRNLLVSNLNEETNSKENTEEAQVMNVDESTLVEDYSWKFLARSVNPKAFLCLISALIHKKKTDPITEKSIMRKIKAAHLYLLCLAIPGSRAFNVYNLNLYSHALEVLKLCELINEESSKPEAKGKGKKKDKKQPSGDEVQVPGTSSDENLESFDKNAVLQLLILLMEDLTLVFKKFYLNDSTSCLETTIQTLLVMATVEKNNTSIVFKSPQPDSVSYLSNKTYLTLLSLCSLEHGDIQETVKIIIKEVLKYFDVKDGKDSKTTSTERSVIKNNFISFLQHLLASVGEPSYVGFLILVQQLCIRTPDKAEIRAKNVQNILDVIERMPPDLYAKVVLFILNLVHNGEVKHRVTALDILGKLVLWDERMKADDTHFVEEIFLNYKYILSAISGRCLDMSATVQAKAITTLGNCISSSSKSIRDVVEKVFVTNIRPSQSIAELVNDKPFHMHSFIRSKSYRKGDVDPLPDAKTVIENLEDSISHEKVFVRKAAHQTLTTIFILNKKWMSDELFQKMVQHCRDMSVLVRKSLIKCLTDLLIHYPASDRVIFYWIQGVMPLVGDPEVKSQEKVVEALKMLLLDNLVKNEETETPLHYLPWKLIKLIKKNMQKQFLIVCSKWIEYKHFDSALIDVIKSHIDTGRNNCAWYLLRSISGFMQIEDSQFILDYFYNNVHDIIQVDEDCCYMVTEVLYYSWKMLSLEELTDLKDRLLLALQQFIVPLPLISRYIDLCNLITGVLESSPEAATENVRIWAGNLITSAEQKIARRIGPRSPRVIDNEQLLCQLIFTLGDAAQICPNVMEYETMKILKNILEIYQQKKASGTDKWKGQTGAAVQAATVATIGKFCIQDETIAESTIPLFAVVLNNTNFNAVKINAMIVLTDLFQRHTSLVENYIPDMCACLKDDSVEIRVRTLTLLIDLIQQDFLRLRCPMFFHLLTMIHDEALVIRETVESFIVNTAIIKHKTIIAQHFIESVFHYNGYNDARFSRVVMTKRERHLFSLSGKLRAPKRQGIYNFMLGKMLDDDRFRILYRLCYDILDGVVDDEILLSDSGKAVVLDAFKIICSDNIQLKRLTTSSTDEEEGKTEEELKTMDLKTYAKKSVLSQVVRTNIIENIMPVFIRLKNKLTQMKSPIIDDLRRCVVTMMKDYKDEVKEMLKEDPQFAEEIAFDIRRAERENEEENSEEAQNRKIAEEFLKITVANAVVNSDKFRGTEIQEIMANTLDRSLEAAGDDAITPSARGVDIDRVRAALTPEALAAVYSPRSGRSERTSKSHGKSPFVAGTSKSTPVGRLSEEACDILKSKKLSFSPKAGPSQSQKSRYPAVPGTSKSDGSFSQFTSPKAGPSQSEKSRYSPKPGTSKSEDSFSQVTLSPEARSSQCKKSSSVSMGSIFDDAEPDSCDTTSETQAERNKNKRAKRKKKPSKKKYRK